MTKQELAKIVQAWADGKNIEWYSENRKTWVLCDNNIAFLIKIKYRIKEKKSIARKGWVLTSQIMSKSFAIAHDIEDYTNVREVLSGEEA